MRRGWSQVAGIGVDGHKNDAENAKIAADKAVYETLTASITRMGDDIRQIKIDHREEKQELEKRITELEEKVQKLTVRIGTVRHHALNAFTKLISKECPKCLVIDEAIKHIQLIIEEE
jgi:DNA repair ATPase RecN